MMRLISILNRHNLQINNKYLKKYLVEFIKLYRNLIKMLKIQKYKLDKQDKYQQILIIKIKVIRKIKNNLKKY